jgi:hypothetical protein
MSYASIPNTTQLRVNIHHTALIDGGRAHYETSAVVHIRGDGQVLATIAHTWLVRIVPDDTATSDILRAHGVE